MPENLDTPKEQGISGVWQQCLSSMEDKFTPSSEIQDLTRCAETPERPERPEGSARSS